MAEHQYRNIVELLVEQEVDHQISKLPPGLVASVPSVQVITYVLNRLKPFYACTERGFEEQLKRAEHELQNKIRQLVKSAMALVYKNPLADFHPLQSDEKEMALKALRSLFNNTSMQLQDLPDLLAIVLDDGSHGTESLGNLDTTIPRWVEPISFGTPAKPAASAYRGYQGGYNRPAAPAEPVEENQGVTWQDYKRRREAKNGERSDNNKGTGTYRNYRLSS